MKKIIAACMAVLMIISIAGCGAKDEAEITESQETQIEVEQNIEESEPASKPLISDFYGYANSEWLSENSLRDFELSYSKDDDYDDIIYDRIEDAFASGEFEGLSEDDSLYKLNEFYKLMSQSDQYETTVMDGIYEMTQTVLKVKSLHNLEELMKDEDYSLFNNYLNVELDVNANGDYVSAVYPKPLMELYRDVEPEYYACMAEGYLKQLVLLGYDEQEAMRIVENGLYMDQLIHSYISDPNIVPISGYTEYRWNNTDCAIDIMAILDELGYRYTSGWGEVESLFFMSESYIDWINVNITEENLDKIKDFYVLSILDKTALIGSNEYALAYSNIINNICGAEELQPSADARRASACMISVDTGVLSDYFARTYITDNQRQVVEDLTAEIKAAYIEIINDIEWLDMKQKERLTIRLKHTKVLPGSYEEINTLEDFEVSDNVLQTYLSLLKSNRRFTQRLLTEGNPGVETAYPLLTTNAYYDRLSNTVILADGMFMDPNIWEETTYEQKLATVGAMIAHEMGHSFDTQSIGLKKDGTYDENWNSIAEYYYYAVNALYEYYNGMQTENMNPINGVYVINEVISDNLGIDATLRVLAKHENAEYSMFFEAYAADYAEIERPEYERFLLQFDNHPTARERVNGVLSQFDEFYDVYNIDTGSTFYLSKDERIHVFSTEK